jgi:methylglutamate dehydrogenase subunit D
VVDFVWNARSPLQQAVVPGRAGAIVASAGVKLAEIRDFDLVQIFARRGQRETTAKAVKKYYGVEAPAPRQAVFGRGATLIWSGPDQVMALSARKPGTFRPLDALRESFEGIASLSDQSDGRCLIRMSGPQVRAMMAKLTSVDLHDSVFPIGTAATTSIDHTAVNLWRSENSEDGSPVFNVLVFSSFADSIWHTIVDAAAEYGIEIETRTAASI